MMKKFRLLIIFSITCLIFCPGLLFAETTDETRVQVSLPDSQTVEEAHVQASQPDSQFVEELPSSPEAIDEAEDIVQSDNADDIQYFVQCLLHLVHPILSCIIPPGGLHPTKTSIVAGVVAWFSSFTKAVQSRSGCCLY